MVGVQAENVAGALIVTLNVCLLAYYALQLLAIAHKELRSMAGGCGGIVMKALQRAGRVLRVWGTAACGPMQRAQHGGLERAATDGANLPAKDTPG